MYIDIVYWFYGYSFFMLNWMFQHDFLDTYCFECLIFVYIDTVYWFYGYSFSYLIGCFSRIIWTPVLSVLYACLLYFFICTCSAQLSMFHMERRSRNTLIIIIISSMIYRRDIPFWSETLHMLYLMSEMLLRKRWAGRRWGGVWTKSSTERRCRKQDTEKKPTE